MRKLIVSCLVTLDGVHAEPRSWAGPYFDELAAESSLQALLRSEAMLMGRHTYDYFAEAWSQASGAYPDRLNQLRKYVYSSTLPDVSWNNAVLVRQEPVEHVRMLKAEGGADLMIYGYSQLAQALLEADLVDELQVAINPVMLGAGEPLFRPGTTMPLRLAKVEEQSNGVVWLRYQRA